MSPGTKPLIRIAVYGTLKRGYWNHKPYCGDAVSIENVTVRGRLYELPSGIPVLRVPSENILGEGTRDLLTDAVTQERFTRVLARTPVEKRYSGDWDWVHCELMTFDGPGTRVLPIDRLEGFRPGQPSLYRRVLVPVVRAGGMVTAWCYVDGGCLTRSAVALGKVRWP